jgi:hypothetical protein
MTINLESATCHDSNRFHAVFSDLAIVR